MSDFEKIYHDNKDFIFKFLLKMTGNPSLSEELADETFFRAYMNFGGLRNKDMAPSWLCTIARNTYYSWWNEQKKLLPLDDAAETESSEDIEETFVQKELSHTAMAELGKLDEPYREVFMLAVFGGLSMKEISELFGKSESFARVTYYRARQKLAERLRKDWQ